ncbi:predicted protein [Phaeodactylum tricornutum CCAP 1055/1]|jgi:hypothetical protein|uniref:R3H-associated N-terminal domain-containing protein n=3 Tax=Phaeodactylum tricornutum TaxID=2850 RepID=B7FQ05_PHATC|nr:predicted protein [Phaeodactylum tricornutum CCAP 1055/1]EEC51769.1 predicted protein [Phaeodactylum tricornutum CCAP 1055/1]|eukprot:XP_002177306.1 predicted protein [Phaeodactylum tricornutum CCAP 1055/1]
MTSPSRRTSFDPDTLLPPSPDPAERPTVPSLSLAALRRSSPHDPSRTLRVTEQERASRTTSPALRLERLLTQRPRSNPRTRTPLRYESPLDPSALRRESLTPDPVESVHESRRLTIRPLAGSHVGTLPARVVEERRATPKSSKQGRSHRTVRRWNNDHFGSLAAEIKSSSHRAAEALLSSQQDAHLYRDVYDPNETKSKSMERFMTDVKLRNIREQFFEGEFASVTPVVPLRPHRSNPTTAADQMNRIDNRLHKVAVRACRNSGPAATVVDRFETFVIATFLGSAHTTRLLEESWWHDLLLQVPTVRRKPENTPASFMVLQFYFDPFSSTGGFHRLLLHAICQFHGLSAISNMVDVGDSKQARALIVSGRLTDAPHRMLQHLIREDTIKTIDHVSSEGLEPARPKLGVVTVSEN